MPLREWSPFVVLPRPVWIILLGSFDDENGNEEVLRSLGKSHETIQRILDTCLTEICEQCGIECMPKEFFSYASQLNETIDPIKFLIHNPLGCMFGMENLLGLVRADYNSDIFRLPLGPNEENLCIVHSLGWKFFEMQITEKIGASFLPKFILDLDLSIRITADIIVEKDSITEEWIKVEDHWETDRTSIGRFFTKWDTEDKSSFIPPEGWSDVPVPTGKRLERRVLKKEEIITREVLESMEELHVTLRISQPKFTVITNFDVRMIPNLEAVKTKLSGLTKCT